MNAMTTVPKNPMRESKRIVRSIEAAGTSPDNVIDELLAAVPVG